MSRRLLQRPTPVPTRRRPYVDLAPFVTRVYVHADEYEVNLVDPDSGLVVYTTPRVCPGEGRGRGTRLADERARRWARRHGLAFYRHLHEVPGCEELAREIAARAEANRE